MAEYIEREAAIAELELYETQVVKNEYALAIAGCRSHIRKLPSADVRPVVRGKWKHGVCQTCFFDWAGVAPFAIVPNFCPSCGADMRGES